jgi:uncharacterized protein
MDNQTYYQKNRDERLEYQQEYDKKNREKIYKRKKAWLKEKIVCECGQTITRNSYYNTHKKTKIHARGIKGDTSP